MTDMTAPAAGMAACIAEAKRALAVYEAGHSAGDPDMLAAEASRLALVLGKILFASGDDAAAKLAEIRTVLDGFEFGRDDLQFAMEQVIDVVYGAEWAGRAS